MFCEDLAGLDLESDGLDFENLDLDLDGYGGLSSSDFFFIHGGFDESELDEFDLFHGGSGVKAILRQGCFQFRTQ